MRTKAILFILLFFAFTAHAQSTNFWLLTNGGLKPISPNYGILINSSSTINSLSTANATVTSTFRFGGVTGTSWSDFCVSITGSVGLCDGNDATGGGGGGSISTSSIPVAGKLAYWTSDSALSDVATGTLTTTATGLEFDTTRGVVGGSSVLSLTSGYVIPTTTPWSGINNFYNLPSSVITAGNALTWTGNTIDFDGGATPSGDLGGTWASPSVTDDSHAHTGATLSGVDISDDTNLTADGTEIILTGDALSLGTNLTFNYATATNAFYTALASTTNLFGASLSACNGPSNALTWSSGLFGCNTITATGDGVSNWLFNGTRLTPSTTAGIVVSASSTISDLSVTNGTTSSAIIPTSINLFGGGAKTTANDFCIQLTGSADLCDGADASGGAGGGSNWLFDGTRLTPSTTVGIGVFASSTIGGGAGDTGLTISGGATTTASSTLTQGSLYLPAHSATFPAYSFSADTDTGMYQDGSNALGFATNGTRRLSVTGTLVSATLNDTGFLLSTTGDVIRFGGSGTLTTPGFSSNIDPDTGFDIISNDGTSRIVNNAVPTMNFTAGSLVGVGSTTPMALLSVHGMPYMTGLSYLFQVATSGGGATTTALSIDRFGTTTMITGTSSNLFVGGTFGFLGDIITDVLTWFDSKIELLSNVVVAAASVWDFGGAASLEIPNGASPTVDATGELALDTTDNQLLMADSGNTVRVVAQDEFRIISITVASTSNRFASGQSLAALSHKDGLEITQYRCFVVGGTSKVVNLTDGTNDTETITCATTLTSDTDVATNDTFTAGELGYLEMGATTGVVDYLHFEAYARITRE